MGLIRNPETGLYESDNPDTMSRLIIEKKANSRGMRTLQRLVAIHEKHMQEAQKQ